MGVLGKYWIENKYSKNANKKNIINIILLYLIKCWGNNQFGQTTVPVAFRRAYAVHTASHTCALAHMDTKSRVGCWGDNVNGEATVPAFI